MAFVSEPRTYSSYEVNAKLSSSHDGTVSSRPKNTEVDIRTQATSCVT